MIVYNTTNNYSYYYIMLVEKMSVLDEVLLEEYDRALRIKNAIEKEQALLPKGSIHLKKIHGVDCYYLQYREGSKVKSRYINVNELEDYKHKIELRKENKNRLADINRNLKQLQKALGKDVIDEYTAKRVY